MTDKPFRAYEFAPNTWHIDGVGCVSYLLVGKEKAMMIDTGMSRNDLHAFVKTITDLPVFVANTHGHFDHTGGNGFFDEVYMSEYASHEAKNVFKVGDFTFDDDEFPLDYTITPIAEGHIFDLGGRQIEAIAIPCHSPGSLAYLDKTNRLLFTGDEIDPGQVLVMGNADQPRRLEDHLANMKKLKLREDEFDYICPAHNGSPIVKRYLDVFIDLDQRIIDGEEGSTQVLSSTWNGFGRPVDPNWRRLEAPGTTGVVYDQRAYPPKK